MTPADIRIRLEEAGRTLMALPMPTGGWPAGHKSGWPDHIRTREEWFQAQIMADKDNIDEMMAGRNTVRVRPQQRQIDALDEVLGWVMFINDGRRRRIVTLRSLVHPITGKYIYGWRRLGRQLAMHENSIRNYYDQGIADIQSGLNKCRLSPQNRLKTGSFG